MPTPPPDKAEIDACRRCPLWENAAQGVAGEGGARAKVMLVGEQPGDEEDRQAAGGRRRPADGHSCIGATALAALSGARRSIAASRGAELVHSSGARLVATYHPSALLRAPDPKAKAELRRAVEEDLATVVRLVRGN